MLSDRKPAPERVSVAIVGAGVGGLALAIGLIDDGIDDFVVLERSDGVGGTWRHNTYPGAACDVPSHLYSYSFAPNADWSRAYARQPEILAYLERCADEAGVRAHVHTGWPVASAVWDESALVWTLISEAGDRVVAESWCSPPGPSPSRASPTSRASARSPGPCSTRRAGTTRSRLPSGG